MTTRYWWIALLASPLLVLSGVMVAPAARAASPARSPAGASGWTLQSIPPLTAPGGNLAAVSCPSSNLCVAVGQYVDLSGVTASLAEVWNGNTWRVVASPNPAGSLQTALTGVSCPASGGCVAVGSWLPPSSGARPLAERWNGTTWSLLPTPAPSNSLNTVLAGVSCPATSLCVAVGSLATIAATETLAETWNGTTWSIQTTRNMPNPSSSFWGSLDAVSCPSAHSCMAVGQYSTATTTLNLAEAWNGTAWALTQAANPARSSVNDLYGVSCPASGTCVAVGYSTTAAGSTTLAEVWNGSKWAIQTSPSPSGVDQSYLAAVTCTGVGACTAVGAAVRGASRAPLTESLSGSRWTLVAAPPSPGGTATELSGVACATASRCRAVGDSANDISDLTFTAAWDGTAWSVVASPSPAGVLSSVLNGLSCAAGNCVAVGYFSSPGGTKTFAEIWNGSTWTIARPANPPDAQFASLLGISCRSPADCVAVGTYFDGTNNLSLAETWNGSAWAIAATPNQAGAQTTELSAVACPSQSECDAVGYAAGLTTAPTVLGESWNGRTWTIVPTAVPADAVSATLASVSCPTAGDCWAVGEYTNTAGSTLTLAEALNGSAWNSSAWSVVTTPNPDGAQTSSFYGVSCPDTTPCEAVGNSFNGTQSSLLAERWDGTSWALQAIPGPTNPTANLVGISCPAAGTCNAVGYSTNAAATADTTLAETWNGTAWAITTTPNQPGSQHEYLNAVSCTATTTTTATTACTAVGAYAQSSSSPALPLAEASHA